MLVPPSSPHYRLLFVVELVAVHNLIKLQVMREFDDTAAARVELFGLN